MLLGPTDPHEAISCLALCTNWECGECGRPCDISMCVFCVQAAGSALARVPAPNRPIKSIATTTMAPTQQPRQGQAEPAAREEEAGAAPAPGPRAFAAAPPLPQTTHDEEAEQQCARLVAKLEEAGLIPKTLAAGSSSHAAAMMHQFPGLGPGEGGSQMPPFLPGPGAAVAAGADQPGGLGGMAQPGGLQAASAHADASRLMMPRGPPQQPFPDPAGMQAFTGLGAYPMPPAFPAFPQFPIFQHPSAAYFPMPPQFMPMDPTAAMASASMVPWPFQQQLYQQQQQAQAAQHCQAQQRQASQQGGGSDARPRRLATYKRNKADDMLYEAEGQGADLAAASNLVGEGTVVLPGVHDADGLLEAGGSEEEGTRSEVSGMCVAERACS